MEEKKKEEKPRYRCAVCNVPVVYFSGELFRPCEHKHAAVTADCSATCTGESKVASQ